MRLRRFALSIAVAAVLAAGCASSKPSNNPSQSGKGFRTLEAVVVGRLYSPPGSPGTTMGGSGSYSLDFEAKDGEATVHYSFPVTRDQYNRYHEGDRVKLVMADNDLRDIRSAN
ncbi:MAG TPA: hypothetical protein VKG01_07725 [Thermoanaerobaculia bacterium]|nr:hypothetical protein [Thermoanaerobaculia bacterium]